MGIIHNQDANRSNGLAHEILGTWMNQQQVRAATMESEPAFFRNLEQVLDVNRSDYGLLTLRSQFGLGLADFATTDFLSLNQTGRICEKFIAEMAHLDERHELGASGARTQWGNFRYLVETEQEFAAFFCSKTAYLAHSGPAANIGVIDAVLRQGYAVICDELAHASINEGIKLRTASHKVAFPHSSPDGLRNGLAQLRDVSPSLYNDSRNVLICVESVYSMNGGVCLLEVMVRVAREVFTLGNAQFLVDEAHSTGTIGP